MQITYFHHHDVGKLLPTDSTITVTGWPKAKNTRPHQNQPTWKLNRHTNIKLSDGLQNINNTN